MKNIFKALAEFQQEVPAILKDTQGYGYTYADLPAIFEVINPLMKKHGMGFYQTVDFATNETRDVSIITTTVFHIESGEKISSTTLIPPNVQLKGMNDFQVLGSAITYIKRYALSSLLGLVTEKDTDASGEQTNRTEHVNVPTITVEQAVERAKQALNDAQTLEEVETIEKQIKASKIIPNRQSAKGKEIQDELAQAVGDKNQLLIKNGAVPFEN